MKELTLNNLADALEEVTPEPTLEPEPTEATLEQLTLPVLREKLTAKDIKFKSTDSKKDLVKALLSGESTIKEKIKIFAPRQDASKRVTPLAIMSQDLKDALEPLMAKGLTYEIDEESCCINFQRDIPTCANLDQPVGNIIRAARDAFRASYPVETSA